MSENEEKNNEELIGVNTEGRDIEPLELSEEEKEKVPEIELKTEDEEKYEYSEVDGTPDPDAKNLNEAENQYLEEDQEDDEEIDFSDIEFDSRGVPVLNSKDLDNICYYSTFVGMKKEMMLMNIKNIYADLDAYFKYWDLPEEERDESFKELYSKENFDATIKTLAKFQREARSKDLKELEKMNLSQVIENTNVTQLWLTSLFINHAVESQDVKVIDPEKSFEENLANNNYFSLFLKEVANSISKKTSDKKKEGKRIFELDFYSSILNKFASYYRTIFYHVGFTRLKYRVGAHTNKIQESINHIIPEYYHRLTRIALDLNPEVKENVRNLFDMGRETPLTDKEFDEKILQVKDILEKDQLYYELLNHPDEDNVKNKICNMILRIYDLSKKLAKGFRNKETFINLLKRICEYLDSYIQDIYKKYNVENLDQLTEYIIEECKKYEEPPEKTVEDMKEDVNEQFGENLNEKEKVENAIEEIDKYEEEISDETNKSQGERDKFTPNNYPFLESVRYSVNILKDFVEYINDPSDLKKANVLLIQLVYNYLNNIIYSVLDSHGFYRRGSNNFILQFIDTRKPVKELDYNTILKETKDNMISPLSVAYQDELVGVFLEELTTAISISEVCKTSDDMMNDLYEYYDTKEYEDEKNIIRIIELCYKKNNIIDIRYQNAKSIIEIYNLILDFIESLISDDNHIKEYSNEIESLLKQQEEYRQRRRNKKLKKHK